ncbi:putative pectinesterase 63 [Carica papaya]|uniref:putative pectinesterase 63 n=1 Tax=Carica papaya TaxID=3649 RepID=UPI000B8CE559|nr:putative pectinesterase 63 [Carica papaya]
MQCDNGSKKPTIDSRVTFSYPAFPSAHDFHGCYLSLTFFVHRVVVWIGGGTYWEMITIDRSKKFITFYGDLENMPTIVFNGTLYNATMVVESDYFMAVNIAFVNSAPMLDEKRVGAQTVAMRISGDMAAFYNCNFLGFQDTLCDDKDKHFFKDCYIRGTYDFIFGTGRSIYLNSILHSVAIGMGVVTAQARESEEDESGFIFLHCKIKGRGDILLGRAWKSRSRVIFAHSDMASLVNPLGWSTGHHPEREKTMYYGEYNYSGRGAKTSGRVGFAKMLSDEEAKPFLGTTFIQGSQWILPPPKL